MQEYRTGQVVMYEAHGDETVQSLGLRVQNSEGMPGEMPSGRSETCMYRAHASHQCWPWMPR